MRIKILIALLILNISCEELLYEEDDKIGIIDNEKELYEAITGIYGLFGDVYNNEFYAACVMADDINLIPNIMSTSETFCSYKITEDYEYDVSHIGNIIYVNLYKTIISTNNLIEQADDIQNIANANTYIGEAYFIRSICYFYLTRFYGEIPIITDLDVKYDIKRSKIPEVYNLIEADMLKAIQLLPTSDKTSRISHVTPHKGAAKAVLAEIYLNMAGFPLKDTEKYKLAAKYAGEVIDSSEFYDMGLLDDFVKLWDIDYFNNPEKIVGLSIEDEYSWSRSEFGGHSRNGTIERYYIRAQRRIIPEFNFYNNFPFSYRKKASFYMGYYQKESYTIEDETYEWLSLVELEPAGYCDFMKSIRYRKWLLNSNFGVAGLYLYRFAHTLLTYAEAKARSNQLDVSAYEAVNKIRRRANRLSINEPSEFDLQEGLSPEQFADSVVQERALEFCAEPEGRWFDILRLEMLTEIHALKYSYEPEVPWYSNIPENNYFMDIPQEDIWLNPNLEKSAN